MSATRNLIILAVLSALAVACGDKDDSDYEASATPATEQTVAAG